MHIDPNAPQRDTYLHGKGPAWFALIMTMALMMFDYIDRQVIVSLFPHIKAAWGLSDKQLGALVSVVSITVALGALPIALLADRASRVKSIVIMATAWSLATISCMFTRNYSQLLVARAMVGVGEAGYGSVGAALIASHFPSRMRGALMAGFFAMASIGSVLGVVLGGVIANRWGWQAAFGVVGVPGLILALFYIKVRDYPTVKLDPQRAQAASTVGGAVVFAAKAVFRSRTIFWVCSGSAAQLIVVSSIWSWMPSFLNRVHGIPADQAAIKAAMVVLCGALGSVVWGMAADRVGARSSRGKLWFLSVVCLLSMAVLSVAFRAEAWNLALTPQAQFALVALGGFLMTCTVGPASAIVMNVIHPGVRATGSSVLSIFQNLFGLALGPVIAGTLSDAWGITSALAVMPLFSVLAAVAFVRASGSYESDMKSVEESL